MSDMDQITLMYKNELEERENNIRTATESVVTGLIKIGFELKKIKTQGLYRYAGYADFNEYVLERFHMDRTAASKMMKLNDTYSEGGFSERIKTNLEEKLNGLGKSLLIEMTSLPEEDYELVAPGMGVKDIRPLIHAENELKKEEKREKELQGQASLLADFPETVPDSEKPAKEQTGLSRVIRELFHPRDMKERLDALVNMDPDSPSLEWWIEDFTRTTKVFNKAPFFLYFHEKEVKIKNVPARSIETKTYKEFYFMVREAFSRETVRGTNVWHQAFGEEWERKKAEEEKQREAEEERKRLREKAEEERKKTKKKADGGKPPKKKEAETAESRKEEPEVVTGEVENTSKEDESKVCDTAQTTDLLNTADDSAGFTITLPAAIGEEIYAIVPESMDENGKCRYKYIIIKPYLYEVRGKNHIKMYYHKDSGDSDSVDIRHLRERHIYPDIVDVEQILEILEGLNG